MERPREMLLDAIRAAPSLPGSDEGIEEVYRFMDEYREWLREYKAPLLMTFAQMEKVQQDKVAFMQKEYEKKRAGHWMFGDGQERD
jgi:hypothetical protein